MRFAESHASSRLGKLIQDLEDGEITPEDRELLMEMLRGDEDARELYLKHMKLAALLRQTAETRGELGTIPVSQEMLERAKRKSAWSAVAWGIAAVLLVALGLTLFQVRLDFGAGNPKVVMTGSQDARYEIKRADDDRPEGDASLRSGDRVYLERGLLRLEFPSKVEAVIEGPSELEMVSGSEIRMDGGMGWFRVPESGKGFAVETERAKVIDLGTEFGLSFPGKDHLEVHVGKGLVRVEPMAAEISSFEVSEGTAASLDAKGKIREIELRPELFRQKFTRKMPYLHWSFDHFFNDAFPVAGTIPGESKFHAELRASDGGELLEQDREQSRTDGIRGGAFAMNGNIFAESAFRGIAGNAPRTVAAWVRHRGSSELFRSPGVYDSMDDPYPGYGATTPFGEQAFLLNYGGTGITTAEGAIGESLEPNTTYELDFHVAARPGVHSATYRIEFVAFDPGTDDKARRDHSVDRPGNVLAYAEGEAVAHNMSEQDRISFSTGVNHPALGKKLAIRLVHRGELVQSEGRTRHSGRVFYDNLRLTKQKAEVSALIFSEGFELSRVAGYARGAIPDTRWVGSRGNYGLFNHHPPFRTPYLSWGEMEEGRMWAGFVEDSMNLTSSTATGSSWLRSEATREFKPGKWVHLASVYTGELTSQDHPEIIHYINGEKALSHPASSDFSASLNTATDPLESSPLRFGASPGSNALTWNGDIDECFIFRGVLDDKEIQKLMEHHFPHFLSK